MKLLVSPLPAVRRLVPTPAGWYTLGLVGLLVGLEMIGRTATTDLHDALAGLALVSAVAITVARHQRLPLPWVSWIGRQSQWFVRRFERLKYDHGIDLRGTPTLPRRMPWWAWAVAVGLVAWAGLAAVGWYYFPDGWRNPGVRTVYLGYLVALLVVWAGLIACVVGGLYVPIVLFERWLRTIPQEVDRRRAEVLLILGYVMLVVALAVFVPTAAVLVLCLVVAAAGAVAYGRTAPPAPSVLWRTGPDSPVFAVPVARLAAAAVCGLGLLAFDLLLTATGGRLLAGGELPESMPLTALGGTAAAWLLPGAIVLAVGRLTAWARNDPSRSTPPTVHIHGHPSDEDKQQAAGIITRWGWRVRGTHDMAEPTDVGIELVPAAQSMATEFDPGWPLRVSLDDLADGAVRERLDRRDEIQLRRAINRGVATLFKQAAGEPGRKRGSGYWFAPHWWFMDSLGREDTRKTRSVDDDPTLLRPVGPPFSLVFPARGRQHLYRVLRATQVDLIYIETGIQHRTVTNVLRQLFEVYDMHAGKRVVEDHHFRGIPKVRVMLHDYSPGSEFRATGYPEPQFDDLSRARVLHVFRDRGDQEELDEVPFDFSWEPAPALGMS